MEVSHPTKLVLAFRSGDKCAICHEQLTPDSSSGNPYKIAVAAHIAGEKYGSVRYDSDMTDTERNSYGNLIYLCANCHTIIDSLPEGEKDYPVAKLRQIKASHEQAIKQATNDAFANVGFPELEKATEWIKSVDQQRANVNFSLIPLEDKLRKNELSDSSKQIITMALSVSSEVRSFIQTAAQTDKGFPERLKSGFLEEYYRLKRKGISGDELFNLMCEFAQRGFKDYVQRAAAQAVLVYLFETCEVFER